jgi:hypothetical protein
MVAGTWQVPSVSAASSGRGYVATWVGIDGWSSPTVEQIGTESDVSGGGQGTYYAWYEMYPGPSVTLNLTIKPGDTISAQVSYTAASRQFTLQISDVTQNHSVSVTKAGANAQRSSAEWIVEAPSSGVGPLPLANFGSQTFTSARATISGTTGAIDNAKWSGKVGQINMTDQFGNSLDTTSGLTDSGSPATSGFTVKFNGATAAAPQQQGHQGGGAGWAWAWTWGWSWWFADRQTDGTGLQQAALYSGLYGNAARSLLPPANLAAVQAATLPAPSVLITGAPSSYLQLGPGLIGGTANANPSDAGEAQQAVMPPALPDGMEPGTPAPPRSAPDTFQMPRLTPDEARVYRPADSLILDRAYDACFGDGRLAPRAPTDGAQAVIDQPAREAGTVEAVAGVFFTVSLGGYWHIATADKEERRRRPRW